MKLEVLLIPACPHGDTAQELAARVLTEHSPLELDVLSIDTLEEATARGFVGSPTFMLDGQDLFPEDGAAPAVACRVYQTSAGLRGLPTEAELAGAISALLAQ